MMKLNFTSHNSIAPKKHVLKLVKPHEKLGEVSTEISPQASHYSTPNNCSFPKNVNHNSEKLSDENQPIVIAQSGSEKLKSDLATLTAKSLMIEYKSEYSAWKNAKSRAKAMQGIKGKKFDVKFQTFPGFLHTVGAKPNTNDSLDRIDPEYGYVDLNVRWASKQLQSENRKFVKEFVVNGESMNLTKIAKLLGISYDALRMRIKRGNSLSQILNNHLPSEPKIGRSPKSISECPWPKGHENEWEAVFKKQAASLCPTTPKSRCCFYVEKCNQHLELLKEEAYGYGYDPLPKNLVIETEYWMELREDASKKLDFVMKNEKFTPALGPTQEELEMREVLGL